MPKVVLDTNVYISSALIAGSIPEQIFEAWNKGLFELIVSKRILEEIQQVFAYPKIRNRCPKSDDEINDFFHQVEESAITTPGFLNLAVVAGDPTDDKFVIAAVEGKADYIVSGDQHLLELGFYENIRIVKPKEFLEILGSLAKK